MRNLSLHFAPNGGSSFIACNMTGACRQHARKDQQSRLAHLGLPPSRPAPLAPNLVARSTTRRPRESSDTKKVRLESSGHLWGGRLDLEGDGLAVLVGDCKRSFDMLGKRSCCRLVTTARRRREGGHTREAQRSAGVETDGHGGRRES